MDVFQLFIGFLQITANLVLVRDAVQLLLDKVLDHYDSLFMGLLQRELRCDGVEMFGDLRATITIRHCLIVILNEPTRRDRRHVWYPALDVLSNEFKIDALKHPVRDKILPNIDLDVAKAGLNEWHSLGRLGRLQLEACDGVKDVACVPTALYGGLGAAIM
jgi:hypothetical protein